MNQHFTARLLACLLGLTSYKLLGATTHVIALRKALQIGSDFLPTTSVWYELSCNGLWSTDCCCCLAKPAVNRTRK